MRPPRIPATFPDSLPISFSYQICPVSKKIRLEIDAPEEWSSALLDGLSLLSHFTQEARRHIEAGYRDLRVQARLDALEADYATIRQAYAALRRSGSKHRAAVSILAADESMPFHGIWTYTTYNWCVRSTPRRPPTLHAVPLRGADR